MTTASLSVAPPFSTSITNGPISHSGAAHRVLSTPSHRLRPASVSTVRSSIASQDSDQFLSYYGSEDAGQTYVPADKHPHPGLHRREPSTGSPSTSTDSLESISDQGLVNFNQRPTKQSSERAPERPARSEEGRDRSHLSFRQNDKTDDNTRHTHHRAQGVANDVTPSNTLRSRRGLEDRVVDLTLVSPSDTIRENDPYPSPPSTAPASGVSVVHSAETTRAMPTGHSRSQSDASGPKAQGFLHQRKSSRDIGIVGVVRRWSQKKHNANGALVFQQPHNRFPSSPKSATDIKAPQTITSIATSPRADPRAIATSNAAAFTDTELLFVRKKSTRPPSPDKAVQYQVPSPSFSPAVVSPFVNYQPGLHATAGPLPPPPRAVYTVLPNSPAPPRPPRLQSPPPPRRRGDMEAVTQALQLPPSITSVLPSKLSTSSSDITKVSKQDAVDQKKEYVVSTPLVSRVTSDEQKPPPTSLHRREGAFSPSISIPSPTSPETPQTASSQTPRQMKSNVDITISTASPTATSQSMPFEPLQLPPTISMGLGLEPQLDESWIKISPLPSREPTPSSEASGRASEEIARPSLSQSRDGHTPSPPPKSPKGFKATLVRRFSSLPRTPSRGSSVGPKTPSPSAIPVRPLPSVQKIKSYWPPAMQCSDVLAKKTALERCVGYAQKINSLYIYDCGLSDWLVEVKYKGPISHRPATQTASGPALSVITPQPRQISGASMISEVTFPRRADASAATDLSVKPDVDNSVPTSPPPLPYPSLPQSEPLSPARSSSVLSNSPSRRMLANSGNFFASLGRKASVRKDKSASNPSSTSLVKPFGNNSPSNPNPRPVNITNTPSVPGGPRAPPNRAQRSKTFIISRAAHQATLNRRPSLFDLSSERPVDPEFVRQVDKLADLLPHADREVLAGYLRRAGQDILAIGQYLEDEKNGTIRRD